MLDVIEDERVLARVREAGEALRAAVREVAARHPAIGDVRGMGLANGVEIVRDPPRGTRAAAAGADQGRLPRPRGPGRATGPHANVLKVRPPLAFTRAEVPIFTSALDAVLAARS